jgi:hypothetical protein
MISQILQMLKSTGKPLSLEMINQKLAVEPSALEAMLELLVKKGKIQKISPEETSKDQGCPLCGGCQIRSYCADSINTPPPLFIHPAG